MIGTHCKGSYKSNYHTIITMTNSGVLTYYTLHHLFIVYFTLSNIKECYIFISTGLCDPNPCHNGGVCHQSGDSYACTCSGDYYGEKCNGRYHYYCIISLRDEVWAQHFFNRIAFINQGKSAVVYLSVEGINLVLYMIFILEFLANVGFFCFSFYYCIMPLW